MGRLKAQDDGECQKDDGEHLLQNDEHLAEHVFSLGPELPLHDRNRWHPGADPCGEIALYQGYQDHEQDIDSNPPRRKQDLDGNAVSPRNTVEPGSKRFGQDDRQQKANRGEGERFQKSTGKQGLVPGPKYFPGRHLLGAFPGERYV